jgi:hypothetical protein
VAGNNVHVLITRGHRGATQVGPAAGAGDSLEGNQRQIDAVQARRYDCHPPPPPFCLAVLRACGTLTRERERVVDRHVVKTQLEQAERERAAAAEDADRLGRRRDELQRAADALQRRWEQKAALDTERVALQAEVDRDHAELQVRPAIDICMPSRPLPLCLCKVMLMAMGAWLLGQTLRTQLQELKTQLTQAEGQKTDMAQQSGRRTREAQEAVAALREATRTFQTCQETVERCGPRARVPLPPPCALAGPP